MTNETHKTHSNGPAGRRGFVAASHAAVAAATTCLVVAGGGLGALPGFGRALDTTPAWAEAEMAFLDGDSAEEIYCYELAAPAPVHHPGDLEAIHALVDTFRRGADAEWRVRLASAIYTEAVAGGMDPLIVASIVATESSFKSRVRSWAGAVGLMQIRPFVARAVAARHGIEWNGIATLHDPETNVRLGILYLHELLERFDGDWEVALTAYNVGPTRVSYRIRKGRYTGSDYAEGILTRYDAVRTHRGVHVAAVHTDSKGA